MLDKRQGAALLAVIDSGSFERAAQSLHLTPSAVSQRISALESALGTSLVVRGKPCRVTQTGARLVQYLRRSGMLEAEFMADMAAQDSQTLRVAMAVNNDTLATWLLPALADFLIAENILLDLILDDQDHTYSLMEQGQALVCISSAATAMRGCAVNSLGSMRYRLLAAPKFAERWFPQGLQREAARLAPLMVFDRKDTLQASFLLRELGLPANSYPFHHIPDSNGFFQAIRLGLGYGLIPEMQYGSLIEQGALIDLAPHQTTDVPLYWHAWRVQSPKLERLSAQVIAAARQLLPALP